MNDTPDPYPAPGPQKELEGPAQKPQESAVFACQCPLHLQGPKVLFPRWLNASSPPSGANHGCVASSPVGRT